MYCVSSKLVAALASGPIPSPSDARKRVDPVSGKVLRALEQHVLDEVRQSLLIGILEHRAGLHDEAHFDAPRRPSVGAHVVAESVRQGAGRHLRIHRHQLRQLIRADRRGGGLAPGSRRLCQHRGRTGREDECEERAVRRTESSQGHRTSSYADGCLRVGTVPPGNVRCGAGDSCSLWLRAALLDVHTFISCPHQFRQRPQQFRQRPPGAVLARKSAQ